MKTLEFWALRNKQNKKWFYEDYKFTFQDCESWSVETDVIHELMVSRERFFADEMLAKSWCENYCNRYKVELEVVKIEQFTEYKEVNDENA